MELVSHLPLSTSTDVSATGNLVFVARENAGVSIVDVSDPASPLLLSTWRHPTAPQVTRDVRPLAGHLYVSNEAGGPDGLFVLDLGDPASPSLVNALGFRLGFPENVHNLWAANDHLYLAGLGPSGGNVIVRVTDPTMPELLANLEVGVHDNTVAGTTLYTAGGFDGLYLFDVADPSNPVELSHYSSSTPDTAYYAHNAWPIDERHVLLGEEAQIPPQGFGRGSLRVIDFQDLEHPVAVARWYTENAKDDPLITVHNVYVVGVFAYVSHYQDGVRILDVSDPREPVEVGWYDTFPESPRSLFEGCWGVYPFQWNDRIFATDRTHGLFVLRFNGARKATIEGAVRDEQSGEPIPGARIKTVTANRSVSSGGDGAYVLRTGSGMHELAATAPGYLPGNAEVLVGDLATTRQEFLLMPVGIGVEEGVGSVPAPGLRLAVSPNPAATAPSFRITVPAAEAGKPLELAVYSAAGERVSTVLSQAAPAGSHSIRWDGRDGAGRRLAPGVYLVRLSLDGQVAVEKLVLGP
jgi:choice-of-anchor B domain-containing protein